MPPRPRRRSRQAIPFYYGAPPAEAKASATAPLMVLGHLGRKHYAPRRHDQMAAEGYQANVIAYLCIRLIADAVATLPFLTFKGEDEVPEHELAKLIERPSPQRGKARWLKELTAYHLIAGNSFIEAVRPNRRGPPRELYNLRSDRMRIEPSATGVPRAYVYEVGGQERSFEVDPISGYGNVLHLRDFHPLDDWWGFSPTEAAARWIDLDNAGAELNATTLQNGVNSGFLFSNKGIATQAQGDEARARIQDRFGGFRRWGAPMVLGGEWQVQRLNDSLKDMQWTEGMHESARRICAAWNVPHILVVPGESTYANREQARLELWEHTVLPFAGIMLGDLVPWFRWLFEDPELDLRIDVDNIGALEPRRETKRAGALAAFQARVITLNECRAEFGYDEIEGGDEIEKPQPPPQFRPRQEEEADEEEPEDDEKSLPLRLADKPLYAALQVDPPSAAALALWAARAGVPNVVPPNEMHVTTVYSRTPVPLYEPDDFSRELIPPGAFSLRLLGEDQALVLTLDSGLARQRHELARMLGASWDHPEYIPHITLSLTPNGVVPPSAPPFAIAIGPEHVEKLDEREDKGWRLTPRVAAGRPEGGRWVSRQRLEEQFREWLRTGKVPVADLAEVETVPNGHATGAGKDAIFIFPASNEGEKMNMASKADEPDWFDEALDDEALAAECLPVIEAIVRRFGERVIEGLGLEIAFDVSDPAVAAFLRDFAGDRIKGLINETSRRALGEAMAGVVERGGHFDEMIEAIRSVFKEANEVRASTIATTESTRAVGFGVHRGIVQTGVERKQWISTRDAFTRDAHKDLDGTIVDSDKPFEFKGAKAMFPGDFGKPELDINCRCYVKPIADEKAIISDLEVEWKALDDEVRPFSIELEAAVRRGFAKQERRLMIEAHRRFKAS